MLCRALIIFAVLTLADQAAAQRAIPGDNLAYPVLLTLKNSKGNLGRASGFYIATPRAVYLVTAKHVFNNVLTPDPETQKLPETELELLSYSKDQPDPKRISMTVSLPSLKDSGAIRLHATDDVAIVRLAKNATVATVVSVALDSIKTFDQTHVGNDARIHGYPVSLGISQHPQFENDRPLLRKALVAGKNSQKRKIIIDGASYPGNSGGPVIQIERDGAAVHFNVIGLIVSHIPLVRAAVDPHAELALLVGANSGYSVAEPMDSVLELINQDAAEPPQPRVSSIQPQKTPAIGQTSSNRKAQQKTASDAKTSSKHRRTPPANARRAPPPARG